MKLKISRELEAEIVAGIAELDRGDCIQLTGEQLGFAETDPSVEGLGPFPGLCHALDLLGE